MSIHSLLAATALQCATLSAISPDTGPASLQAALADLEVPVALSMTAAGGTQRVAAAVGLADPDTGRPMTPDTPVRIASITKTFVAATVLRLHEEGRVDLDASIAGRVDPALLAILEADGYRTDLITVRHLLQHSAGLYDQGSDPRFVEEILAAPDRVWTRASLLERMTAYADPPSLPGTEYRYSDAGYILLGDFVERVTGMSLAAAVREALRFDALGLGDTWWELVEEPPRSAAVPARQYIGDADSSGIHPSFDLYGGGGLLATASDLATFMAALFEGRVFDRPETLDLMRAQGAHAGSEQYRLGLQAKQVDGRDVYFHSGFWGTIAYYDPATRRAVAAVGTRKATFRAKVLPTAEALLGIGTTCAGERPAR